MKYHYTVYYVEEESIFVQSYWVEASDRVEALDAFLEAEIPHRYVALVLCNDYEGSEY